MPAAAPLEQHNQTQPLPPSIARAAAALYEGIVLVLLSCLTRLASV